MIKQMTRDEALEILEIIADVYPRFELTKRKAEIWLPGLQKMEFQGVKRNLENHVAEKVYPPTIAEISAYPKENNIALEKQIQFEQEARLNPATEDIKQEFWNKINALLGRDTSEDELNDN